MLKRVLEQKNVLILCFLDNKSNIAGVSNNSYFHKNIWFAEPTENVAILIS